MTRDLGEDAFSFGVDYPPRALAADVGGRMMIPAQTALMMAAMVGVGAFMLGLAAGAAMARATLPEAGDENG